MNMLTLRAARGGLVCRGLRLSLKKKKKLAEILLPSQDDVFLQFKYLLILLFVAKPPLKLRSSIRTNDSVSVQRDSARGSAVVFLTAYLSSREIQNQKCMQMVACFSTLMFSMIWGLHIQVGLSVHLALATLLRITPSLIS